MLLPRIQPRSKCWCGVYGNQICWRLVVAIESVGNWWWQSNLSATGSSTADRHLRFWRAVSGYSDNYIDSKSLVCSIFASPYNKEFFTSHGFLKIILDSGNIRLFLAWLSWGSYRSSATHCSDPGRTNSYVRPCWRNVAFWGVLAESTSSKSRRHPHGDKGFLLSLDWSFKNSRKPR